MRIALVVERFQPTGGVEQVAWMVARGLVVAGDQVDVYARGGEAVPGVRLHRVRAPAYWQPLRFGVFAAATARAVAGDHYDVVHSFCRTPHQHVFHAGGGSHADYMLHTYGARNARWRRWIPRHALQLALERHIFADPGQIVQCVSPMVARDIARRHGVPEARLEVIPNAVDSSRFASGPRQGARRRLRAELGAGDAPLWLLAGSGWRRKGLDVALRALAACKARDTRLWVAGSDRRPRGWRALSHRLGLGQRVRFLGLRPDLEDVYAAADGLLHPARYEPFGLVCLEAAAAGLPVVASATTGAAELLGGAAQVVATAEDAAGYARAMDELADPRRRARLGERGREIAALHDWPSHVTALRALYKRVLS